MTPRFCPSIEFLFTEHASYEARVAHAAALGAAAVEIWGWQGKDLAALRRSLDANGIAAAVMVIDPLVGALADPHEFSSALDRTVDAARVLGCDSIIVISGARGARAFADAQAELADVLHRAVERMAGSGVGLALEALNTNDHPLTHLMHLADALDVVAQVDSPALGVVVDLWHTSLMGDAVAAIMRGHHERVRHVQLARVPDRSEPCGDDLPNGDAVPELVQGGYRGVLGFEYRPTCPSDESYAKSVSYWQRRLA